MKLGSAWIIHIVFLAFGTIILNFSGYYASWYYLQIVYYMFAAAALVLSVGMITASLAVYIRDVIQIVGIIIQIGFWVNPICWGMKCSPVSWGAAENKSYVLLCGRVS